MSIEERVTVVVNCKTEQYDVLVDRTTIFGNPFPEWRFGREDCIKRHRKYFYDRLERDPAFKAAVLGLRGLRLGCHCKPLSCHGDTIAEYLLAYDWLCRVKGETGNG